MNSPLKQAFFHPLNLVMLGATIISGLCSAWWLFPIGLGLWAIMFLLVYRDPSLRLAQELEARPIVAYRFRPSFERIQKVQVALHNNLSIAKPDAQRAFEPIQEQVDQLVDRTHDLCMRMSALENNRKMATMNRDLNDELALMGLKIAQAEDEQVRQRYTETRKSVQDRIDDVRQIGNLLDQFDGQMLTLCNTLESLQGDVVRMLAVRKKDIQPDVAVLQRTLFTQAEQLDSLEKEATQIQ